MGNEVSQPAQGQGSSSKFYAFKVVVLGDRGVGKTSIINRLVHGVYMEKGKPTKKVEFGLHSIPDFESTLGGITRHSNVRLMIWDVSGQEKFEGKTRLHYEHTHAGIVVIDASRPSSIEEAEEWMNDLRAKVNSKGPAGERISIPIIVFVNKADKVSAKQVAALTPSLKDITRANDVLGFWTCSAKEGYNFEKSIHALVTKILEQRFSDEIKQERSEGYSHKNWQPDELASHCALCQGEFSFFIRKHHCRNCGLIYCSACTPHVTFLAEKGYRKPVRVCSSCHHTLTAKKEKPGPRLSGRA